MLTRKRISSVAKLVLGVLLFAQVALAFAACDLSTRAPAQAISVMGDMPCCAEDEAPDGSAANVNLCLAHCTSDAQRVDTTGLAFPAFPGVVVLVVSALPVPGYPALRGPSLEGYAFAAPPRTILFQNFRI
jgi:hypothetical protein